MTQTSDTRPSPSARFEGPHPEHGWSREILTLEDAAIWPVENATRAPACGVADREGRDVPEAAFYRGHMRFIDREDSRMIRPVSGRPRPGNFLPGRHMWGGQVFVHFGHFLCESITRLWAAQESGAESILVIGRNARVDALSGWQTRLLELLDIHIPIRFVTEPTTVETLVVPGQGFGLGRISRGTPEFRRWVSGLSDKIEPKGADKLYISRTETGFKGRLMHERFIQDSLESAGYLIYHPQQHSLEEQLAQYKKATHIVGTDGSAFHLAALVARADQRFAIILRRNMMAYYNIVRQLEGFTGTSPDVINALKGDWMPAANTQPNRETLGEADQKTLHRELVQRGYFPKASVWQYPTEKDFGNSIRIIRKHFGQNAILRPAARPIDQVMAGVY